jgi:hypothetical protein
MARGDDSSPFGWGLGAAFEVPVVGAAVRVGVEKALEMAVKASVEGSVLRVTREYGVWAQGAAARIRRERARGLRPAALEEAAAASAADEELRRIRAENAELRRLIADAEGATRASQIVSSPGATAELPKPQEPQIPAPPPLPPLPPSYPPPASVQTSHTKQDRERPTNGEQETDTRMSSSSASSTSASTNHSAGETGAEMTFDVSLSLSPDGAAVVTAAATGPVKSSMGPKLVVPSPEPEHVDDTIVQQWNQEVDQLTADYRQV